MESSQIIETVVEDQIRQSVRSIVLDVEANPWEVIVKQYGEGEYEQVVVVLQEVRPNLMRPQVAQWNDYRCLNRSRRPARLDQNV